MSGLALIRRSRWLAVRLLYAEYFPIAPGRFYKHTDCHGKSSYMRLPGRQHRPLETAKREKPTLLPSPSVLKSERADLVAFLPRELAPFDERTPRAASPILLQVPRPYASLLPLSSVPPGRKGKKRREGGRASSRLRHVPGGGGKYAPEGQCRLSDEDAQVSFCLNHISPPLSHARLL